MNSHLIGRRYIKFWFLVYRISFRFFFSIFSILSNSLNLRDSLNFPIMLTSQLFHTSRIISFCFYNFLTKFGLVPVPGGAESGLIDISRVNILTSLILSNNTGIVLGLVILSPGYQIERWNFSHPLFFSFAPIELFQTPENFFRLQTFRFLRQNVTPLKCAPSWVVPGKNDRLLVGWNGLLFSQKNWNEV